MESGSSDSGFRFFGSVTAAVSHEIKNHIAVINEQVGLLEDWVYMSQQGRELSPEQLMELTGKIKKQIHKTDDVIKNLNYFSHSVDHSKTPTDLNVLLEFSASLFRRMVLHEDVQLQVSVHPKVINVMTSPYMLMWLIWKGLKAVIAANKKINTITLSCEETGQGKKRIQAVGDKKLEPNPVFSREISELAQQLSVNLSFNEDRRGLTFLIS